MFLFGNKNKQKTTTKCYFLVGNLAYLQPYPINSMLLGKCDGLYADFASNGYFPNKNYNCICQNAVDLRENINAFLKVYPGRRSSYILKMACTAEEAVGLVKKGQFSKGVIAAINTYDWYKSFNNSQIKKIEVVSNKEFNENVLQQILSDHTINTQYVYKN
jgi:hypothetical protein